MVRKVRVLLEEHQKDQGTVPAAAEMQGRSLATAVIAPTAASGPPVASASTAGSLYEDPTPKKSYAQWVLDGIRSTAPEDFVLGQLKSQLSKDKQGYRDDDVKQEVSRLMRSGRVVVVKSAVGRIGNTYQEVPTAEELAEKAAAEAANASGSAEKDASAAPEAEVL